MSIHQLNLLPFMFTKLITIRSLSYVGIRLNMWQNWFVYKFCQNHNSEPGGNNSIKQDITYFKWKMFYFTYSILLLTIFNHLFNGNQDNSDLHLKISMNWIEYIIELNTYNFRKNNKFE